MSFTRVLLDKELTETVPYPELMAFCQVPQLCLGQSAGPRDWP